MKLACKARPDGQAPQIRTIITLEKCQHPLINQSENYRAEVSRRHVLDTE